MTDKPSESPSLHLWVDAIQGEAQVSGCYLVKEKRVATTRSGSAFLSLILADRTGEIPAKVWDSAEAISDLFNEGDVVQVEGRAGYYRDQLQLTLSAIDVSKEPPTPEIFVETSPRDPSEMVRSIRHDLKTIENTHLRGLVDAFLSDREFMARFRKAPAAKAFHHSYLGGLLEHTASVCQLAVLAAHHYPQLDRDLLLAGAFLHDIGKIRELAYDLLIDYTDEGRLVGHVVLGAVMLDEKLKTIRGFPQDLAVRLKHLILSHHGQYDFGSPKMPKFLEALALHLIDDLDAKINGIGRFMERDRRDGSWTEFNRMFSRYFLKGRIGDVPTQTHLNESLSPHDQQGILFSS